MTASIDRAARLAEILADPNFEPELLRRSLAGDPFELAETTGRIGGQLPDHQPKLVGLGIRDEKAPLMPNRTNSLQSAGPGRPEIPLPGRLARVKVRMRSDGLIVKTRYSCNWCGPCLRWWRYTKRHKYEWGTSGKPEQTIVVVCHGLADDDVASAAVISIGRAGKGPRFVSLARNPLTYHWGCPGGVCQPAAGQRLPQHRTRAGTGWPGMHRRNAAGQRRRD